MSRIALLAFVIFFSGVSALRPGREYVYKYEAQTTTGVPDSSLEFTGITLKCHVRLQMLRDYKVKMRMEDVRLFYTNDLLDEVPQFDVIRDVSKLRPVPVEFANKMVPHLVKPMEFKFEEKMVADMKAESSDPEWSVNMKRGFIYILQVNPKQENAPSVNSPYTVQRSWSKVGYKNTTEKTLFGRCPVSYAISSQPFRPHPDVPSQVLNISKVFNMEACKDSPIFYKSAFKMVDCPKCKKFKEPIKTTNEIRYNMVGDEELFEIEDAHVTGRHVFSPYQSMDKGHAITFVHQKISILQSTRMSDEIHVREPKVEKKMKMKIPKDNLDGDRVNNEPTDTDMTKVYEILSMVTQNIDSVEQQEKMPYLMLCLVKVMEMAKTEHFEQLTQKYFTTSRDNPDMMRTRSLIMDLLPMLGTKPSLTALESLIEKRHIKGEKLAQILSTIPLTYIPDEEILTKVKNLCSHPVVLEDLQTKRTCFLAYTALLNKFSKKKCGSELEAMEDKYWPELDNMYETARREEDKILALKAIGNTGFVKSLPLLVRVAQDITKPKIVRYQALLSMKHLALKKPDEVLRAVIPVFMKRSECTEVRVVSFLTIMETMPSVETLDLIAARLDEKEDSHVTSYVYSFWKDITKTTLPHLKKYAKDVEVILNRLPVSKLGVQYPKQKHIPIFYKSLNFGTVLDMTTIPTEKSFLPKAARMSLKTHILGNDFNVMEVGYYMDGLQTILEKLMGPHGSLKTSKSTFDIFKSKLSERNYQTRYNDRTRRTYRDEPHVTPRDSELPQGFMYMKMFDQAMRLFTVEKEELSQFMNDKRISVGEIVNKLREGMSVDFQKTVPIENGMLVMPTACGLPLKMDLTALAHVHVKQGHVKAQVLPAFFESERQGQPADEVKVKLDVAPKMIVGMTAEFGTMLHTMKLQTTVRGHVTEKIPVDVEMSWKLRDGRVEMDIPVLKQEEKRTSMKLEPVNKVTIIDPSKPLSSPVFHERPIKTKNALRKDIVYPECSTFKDKLGIQTDVRMTYMENMFGLPMAYYPFNGLIKMDVVYRPTADKAEHIIVAMETKRMEPGLYEESNLRRVSGIATDRTARSAGERSSIISRISNWFGYDDDDSRESETENERETETERQIEREREREREDSLFIHRNRRPVVTPLEDQVEFDTVEEREVMVNVKVVKRTRPEVMVMYWKLKNNAEGKLWSFQLQMVDAPSYSYTKKKVCVHGFMRYPDNPHIAYEPPQSEELREVKGELKLMSGEECSDDTMVMKIEMKAEKSLEQLHFERTQQFKLWPEYKECQRDLTSGIKYSTACRHMSKTFNELFQYKFDVVYKKEKIFNWLKQYSEELRVYVGALCDNDVLFWTRPDIDEDKLLLEVVMKPPMGLTRYDWRKSDRENYKVKIEDTWFWNRWLNHYGDEFTLMNMKVKNRWWKEEFKNVEVPVAILPVSVDKLNWVDNYLHLWTDGKLPAVCQVGMNRVQTFDNVDIHYPMEAGCEAMLAKDCSSDNRFSLTLKTQPGSRKKILKMKVEGRVIELKPNGDECEVKVDNRRVNVDFNSPFIVRKDQDDSQRERDEYNTDEKKPVILAVMKILDGTWGISAPLTEAKVYFNGMEAYIETSPFYYGKMCGLCGPFNGRVHHQLISRIKSELTSGQEMFLNYIIPGDTCRAEREPNDRPYTIHHGGEFACEAQLKNYIYHVRSQGRTCVSTRPRITCPRDTCRPTSHRQTRFPMFCIHNDDPEYSEIMREVEAGPVSFLDRPIWQHRYIPEDASCERN